jgi:hypothetical protein
MALNQYTKCCSPTDYSGPFLGSVTMVLGIILSLLAGIFDPGAGVLGLILTAIAFCRWWLYGRLVCLGGNRCAIGLALGVYTAHNQTGLGKFDTDFGVQLLFPPSKLSDSIQDVGTTNAVQGFLVRDQSADATNPQQPQLAQMMQNYDNLGFTGEPEPLSDLVSQGALSQAQVTALGLKSPGDFASWQAGNFYLPGSTICDSNGMIQVATVQGVSGNNEPKWSEKVGGITVDNFTQWKCEGGLPVGTLEVEFEGSGMWDLYNALLAASVPATAAAAVCAIPVFGWIACLVLILISLAIIGIGMGIALNDQEDPQSDPAIGTIHPGKDILFILGTWIYDSFHSGWNELHPVLHCQKIGEVNPNDMATGNPWATPVPLVFNGNCTTNGTAVTRVDGNQFNHLKPGETISIGGTDFTIATVVDGNSLTLTASAGITPGPTPWNAVAPVSLDDPKLVSDVVQVFCGLATDANSPGTIAAQSNLENGWTIHPVVDGCTPRETTPVIA